ncbi:MAG TPA: ATP-binding protein [Casimicrobiaceae bacterium]|nr:ATP-binding protein [Casimicrobiaceae bacterium]
MGQQLGKFAAVRSAKKTAPQDSAAQFRSLLDKLPAGGYTCDSNGLITHFNQHAVKLWGRAPRLNDPVDRFCGSFKLFAKDGAPIAHDACWMAKVLQTGKEYNGEEIIIERPDGRRLTALAHANPIRDETGEMIGAVNVLVDITDRIQAEKVWRGSRDELAKMVSERTAELTRLSQHLLQVAEDEKAKLAAEVHDDFGSILTLLSLKLGDMGKRLSDGDPHLVAEHRDVTRLLRNLIDSQRRIVGSLRPVLLDSFGLGLAVRHHVEDWAKDTGLDVQVDLPTVLPVLDPDLALALFRVIQESLTNIAKHAQASSVRLTLTVDGSGIGVSIEDDGAGVSPSKLRDPNSHGIIGMRERIARFGGTLNVSPDPDGQGTRVVAAVPLRTT